MTSCEELKMYLPEYWDGALDEADRLILEAHLDQCPACRAEAAKLRHIWKELGGMGEEVEPGERLRRRFYDRLEAYRSGAADQNVVPIRKARPAPRWIAAAAIAAALVVGFMSGYLVDAKKDGGQVAQLRGEVNSMRQLVALSLLQQQSASDRLQGVSWAYRVERSDTEVLSALLDTVNHDANVSVRLAAVDALKRFAGSPVAHRGMAQAIARQDSPMVQMALLDQLTELHDSTSAATLEAVAADTRISKDVRERAKWVATQMGRQWK